MCGRIVYLGMNYVETSVELVRLAEKQKYRSWFQTIVSVLYPTEEDQFHHPALVLYHDTQLLARHLYADHLGEDLDIGARGLDVGDSLDGASVNITERKGAKKVSDSGHTQLRFQKRGPFRPHSRKKLHLCVQLVPDHGAKIRRGWIKNNLIHHPSHHFFLSVALNEMT